MILLNNNNNNNNNLTSEDYGGVGFFLKLSISTFQSLSTLNWLKTSSYSMLNFSYSVCDQTLVI